MKRTLFIIALCVIACDMHAQVWSDTNVQGDELLGETSNITHTFHHNGSRFTYWSDSKDQFCIVTDAMLNNHYSDSFYGQIVAFGLYSEDGKLIENDKMWLEATDNNRNHRIGTRNAGFMSCPVGQGRKAKRILSFIENETGYVRFVVSLYNAGNMSVIVKCRKSCNQ